MTKICNKEESTSALTESSGGPPPPAKSLQTNKVKKSGTNPKVDNVSNDEMQTLLAKLRELVPNIPRHKKLTKLEIIQYVIDYIFDLQLALEAHPQSVCQSSNNSSPTASIGLRQPLAIKYSS